MDIFEKGIEKIKLEGGKIICGGKKIEGKGYFVEPTIVEATKDSPFLKEEFFCPILFVLKFKTLE